MMTFEQGIMDCTCDPAEEMATLRVNLDRARAERLIGIGRRTQEVRLCNLDEMDSAVAMFTSAKARARAGFERRVATDSLAALRRIGDLIREAKRRKR